MCILYACIILTAWVFAACFAILGSEDLSAWNGQIKDSAPFFMSVRNWNLVGQNLFEMSIHIGEVIRAELQRQGRSVKWFQQQINRSHSAVYDIFKSRDINTELLTTISNVLNHNFFKDLSDNLS